MIRIQSTEDKTRVDMRSVSRVGLSDLGTNTTRIQQFMEFIDDLREITTKIT
nr:DUF1499 domain-containing protein [Nitrosomonas sp.]